MTIKLQPREESGTLPYPYFIDEKGKVGRQDFWKGKPSILLGFNSTSVAGDMVLELKDFLKKPKLAIGKFPVFSDKKDNWFTSTVKIESAELLK